MREERRSSVRSRAREAGFTLVELLAVSVITLLIVAGALAVYVRSNKTSADQQQYARLQQDVRAAMYFVSRDARMAGADLSGETLGNGIEGVDNENQGGAVRPDRLKIMGNIELPFKVTIVTSSGSGNNIVLGDYALQRYPYTDAELIGKVCLILPNPASGCSGAAVRTITNVKRKERDGQETLSFTPGGGVNPPGGLGDVCPDAAYDGGTVIFVNVRQFWLDVTGNYPGLVAGANGYIGGGQGGILYLTDNATHYPIAQNIENIQFQYNGDMDGDANATLDGFQDWNAAWTVVQRARIRQVKIWVLGRTQERFALVSNTASHNTYLYRRPAMANSAAAAADDGHKRYLLESTSNLRNLTLAIYNRTQER